MGDGVSAAGAIRRLVPQERSLRLLASASLVNALGTSLLITTLVLYFTQVVGLGGAQVGLGLTLGGALGLLIGVPLGHAGDELGAGRVLIGLLALQTLATAGYVLVDSFSAFLAVAVVAVALERGASAVRQGLIARALPVEGRVPARAYLRAVTNGGFAAGSVLATIGIAIGTRTGYQAMILIDAASFPFVALMVARLPRADTRPPARTGPRLAVLRDTRFLAVTGVLALLGIQLTILDVGLPLWVAGHTAAPAAIVGVVFVLNCVAVAAFSVRMARGSDTPAEAAGSARRSGVALIVCCGLLAASGSLPAVPAAALIIAAMLAHVAGEMWFAAGQWSLSFGLAPEALQGQYQAAGATGFAFALMTGPLVMAGVVALGPAGWLGFGVAMLVLGFCVPGVVRWATR